MARIWETSKDLVPPSETALQTRQPSQGASSQDLWMLLLVRMITRADPDEIESGKGKESSEDEKSETMEVDTPSGADRIRQTLFDYILTDFRTRYVALFGA